jgi:hypothetical protein
MGSFGSASRYGFLVLTRKYQFFSLKLKMSVPVDSSDPLLNFTWYALRIAIALRDASDVVEPSAWYSALTTFPAASI